MKIGDVTILSVDVELYGGRNSSEDYDFGALYLELEGRKYILDTVQTFWTEEGGFSTVECSLEKDEETFEETGCKYDLDDTDILDSNLKAEFYIGGSFSNSVEKITLFVKYGEMTVAIDVKEE